MHRLPSLERDPILLQHIETIKPNEFKFYIRLRDFEKNIEKLECFIYKNGDIKLENGDIKSLDFEQQFIWTVHKRIRGWAEVHKKDLEAELNT